LYHCAQYQNLFDLSKGLEGILPYLLKGQGIPTNHMDNDAIQIRWTTSYLGFDSTIKKHKKISL
jgi:hypothetical protein